MSNLDEMTDKHEKALDLTEEALEALDKGREKEADKLIEQAKKFEGQKMSPETARAIQLLKLATAMPAPKDPAKLADGYRIRWRFLALAPGRANNKLSLSHHA